MSFCDLCHMCVWLPSVTHTIHLPHTSPLFPTFKTTSRSHSFTMDFYLRCNALKCRYQLKEQAVVTTCSYVVPLLLNCTFIVLLSLRMLSIDLLDTFSVPLAQAPLAFRVPPMANVIARHVRQSSSTQMMS